MTVTPLDEPAADARYAQLEWGSAHLFADWPNRTMDRAASGVYTIWDAANAFIYVGMAGKNLDVEDNRNPREPTGLLPRMNAHASGRLSADQFCVYVANRLVVPYRTEKQREQTAAGEVRLDGLTRAQIREHYAYRYVNTPDGPSAIKLEIAVQRGALDAGKPLLNPR